MSPEERLNPLERDIKSLAISDRRWRKQFKRKFKALIDAQNKTEYLFNKRLARRSAAQDRSNALLKELIAARMNSK